MMAIAAAGYALVGVLFAVLTVLLVTSWRGHKTGSLLIAACLASVFWGVMHAWVLMDSAVKPPLILFTEVVRSVAWIGFLVFLVGQIGVSLVLRVAALLTCVATFAVGAVAWVEYRWFGGTAGVGQSFFVGGLAMALAGLMLIEQLYRNSPIETRWALKPLVLGLGGIFAFDMFLYSQAVLLGGIDATTWNARGAINLLFVPAIAVAARRNPDWELRIFVSRQVVFYSTSLVAVGAYLLMMSLGGYLLMRFGGSWGTLSRIVFFAGAALVLMILLFSSTLRAQLKVFLNKHFFHNKYDYREEWMRLIATLGEFQESSTRTVAVKAVAQVVGSLSGVLWVKSGADTKFLEDARYNYDGDIPDIEFEDPIISFMIRENWLIDLAEYNRSPGIYTDLQMPDWVLEQHRAWLFIPLMFGRQMIGLIMLTEAAGPPRLNYEDRDLLKTVANHSAVHIAQSLADRMLTEAQQFETYHKLTAFLMHDMNNLIAQQSLIVANAEKHRRNPDFVDDAIKTIAGSVDRMKRAMERLRQGPANSATRTIELRFLASAAVDRCSGRDPVPELQLNGTDASVSVNHDEFVLVLTHLIRNAQDACADDGKVLVAISDNGVNSMIQIEDNGAGMTQEFMRERLFRPFDSTKGSKGMGIGVYQARELARNLGGDLTYVSKPNSGTTCTLTLPTAHSRM